MLNPDNATLEWCAKWIEDSLRAETNERTIEFDKNMAMTIRAVKTATPSDTPVVAREIADKIVELLKPGYPIRARKVYVDTVATIILESLAATTTPSSETAVPHADELERLSKLEKGWDSYGGSPIDPRALEIATYLSPSLEGWHIAPRSDGMIQFERGDDEIVIDTFKPSETAVGGSVTCIHCDPSFVPTGPDDWCECRCHENELQDPPIFRTTKEAMEYAQRNKTPIAIPVPPAGAAPADENSSVQPEWATALPFQQQSVMFLGARGSDGIEKIHQCKAVQRAYRATVFKAAKYGRLLEWGEKADSFMSLDRFADDELWAEDVKAFFDGVDGLPHHGYQHLMLGCEILGYKHPDPRFRDRWYQFYLQCVDNLHLNPETETQMDERLSDWHRKHWTVTAPMPSRGVESSEPQCPACGADVVFGGSITECAARCGWQISRADAE